MWINMRFQESHHILAYRVVCFHVSMLKPMMYEDFLGVWLLTKVQWTAPPNCMLGTWKLPNTLQKHPSLLSSKHSTSGLYFCALWFVILDLYSSCWIKDIANSVSPTCLDCYSSQTWVLSKSPLSHRKAIFTFALSGRWEDNTLVRNRWSVAGSNTKARSEHPWLRERYCKSWLPVTGVLWQWFLLF